MGWIGQSAGCARTDSVQGHGLSATPERVRFLRIENISDGVGYRKYLSYIERYFDIKYLSNNYEIKYLSYNSRVCLDFLSARSWRSLIGT